MKTMRFAFAVSVIILMAATPAYAQGPQTSVLSGGAIGAGLGMALSIIGAGYGLGRIGSAAVESMARQPEAAPRIQIAMIIVAAMLEGATLASVVLSFVIGNSVAQW